MSPYSGTALTVTLRQGLKPHGFFCLSSVVDELRNGAWLRLIAHRSGGGKARNSASIQAISFLGGALPVPAFMPCTKGSMAHNLCLASWKAGTPTSFEAQSWGTYPPGWRLSLRYSSVAQLFLKAVEWLPVPSLRKIADTLGHTVVFLPLALRQRTRTLFSSQGTTQFFLLEETKAETARDKVSNRLTTG